MRLEMDTLNGQSMFEFEMCLIFYILRHAESVENISSILAKNSCIEVLLFEIFL